MKHTKVLFLSILPALVLTIGVLALPAQVFAGDERPMQAGQPVFHVNENSPTIVRFGGRTWAVVGYNGVGNSTQGNTITLLTASESRDTERLSDYYSNSNNEFSSSRIKALLDSEYNALSGGEKKMVIGRDLTGGSANYSQAGYNSDNIAGSTVNDQKFWPLSVSEAEKVNTDILNCIDNSGTSVEWWLRSPGNANGNAAYALSGIIDEAGKIGKAINNELWIRSAFYLDLTNVLYTTQMGWVDPSETLFKLGALSGDMENPIKFKVKDLDLTLNCSNTGTRMAKSGDTVSIDYTGAKTGGEYFVSCVIKNSSGALFYGKIVYCGDSSSANGTASFVVPDKTDLPEGNYTIELFNELCSLDVDFCSDPVIIPLSISRQSATVGQVDVDGVAGQPLTARNVNITLVNDTVATGGLTNVDARSWFSNLPAGVTARANGRAGENSITITLAGTPKAASTATFNITIPANALTRNEPLAVTANANAKFSITMPANFTVPVTKIDTPLKTVYIKSGKSLNIPFAIYNGKDETKAALTWTSSNKKIKVSQSGKVTVPKSMKKGKTTITATAGNGTTLKVTVKVSKKAVALKKMKVSAKKMNVGATQKLKIKLTQKKATLTKITFNSSNASGLYVDKAGNLIAKAKGTYKITIKVNNVKVVKTIKVK